MPNKETSWNWRDRENGIEICRSTMPDRQIEVILPSMAYLTAAQAMAFGKALVEAARGVDREEYPGKTAAGPPSNLTECGTLTRHMGEPVDGIDPSLMLGLGDGNAIYAGRIIEENAPPAILDALTALGALGERVLMLTPENRIVARFLDEAAADTTVHALAEAMRRSGNV